MNQKISEQEQVRRDTLNKLIELGVNPYPGNLFYISTNSVEVKSEFETSPEKFKEVSIAGRIMSRRIMGKASFVEIQDGRGKIQLYISRDDICTEDDKTLYNDVFKKLLDIGDIIGVKGFVFKTKVGEITIHVS